MDKVEILDKQEKKQKNPEIDPWISMLRSPRATIQYIVDTNPKKHIIWLAIIGGILTKIIKVINDYPAAKTSVAEVIISGVIGGIFTLYFVNLLIWLTGKLLKGKGSGQAIRTAIAWSTIPMLWGMLIYVLGLITLLFGVTLPYFICLTIVFLWWITVYSKAIAQVQGYKSAWKGLANIILAMLVPALMVLIGILLRSY